MFKTVVGKAVLAAAISTSLVALAPTASAAPAPLHGMGAKTGHSHSHRTAPAAAPARAAALAAASAPASWTLADYALTPGDQGQVNSCVSWAIAHSAMGLLENEQGITGGPNAPMYSYAQLVRGQNVGTWPEDTLDIAYNQGIDSESDYWQGDYDYTTQPTRAQRANAWNWHISGYSNLRTGSGLRTDVQNAISQGNPVIFSFDVYPSFDKLKGQAARDYSYRPGASEKSVGSHEVTIIGYNSQGVRVENSWGTGWGDGGFVNLSWSYLTSAVLDAHSVGALVTS
ncbi:C1 family peptidase [Kutzneria viridogrisea]|uniref:Peptidase C1A papain n=2 Tax=Kutzneria TaxID=43356 RepID=W5WES2_9PSEU|nr:C1 family peptidase [Kutzneria albida]AHH96639.1 peptidase C1A papain [Kutzneria albida DSM 43870]MBA8928140.1 C1A family cysteine protease [Kutzneria viridogrisea]